MIRATASYAPAFPRAAFSGECSELTDEGVPGMTMREWYAGQALVGILASYASDQDDALPTNKNAAEWAFGYADAMIAESAKRRPEPQPQPQGEAP